MRKGESKRQPHTLGIPAKAQFYAPQKVRTDSEPIQEFKTKFIFQTRSSEVLNLQMVLTPLWPFWGWFYEYKALESNRTFTPPYFRSKSFEQCGISVNLLHSLTLENHSYTVLKTYYNDNSWGKCQICVESLGTNCPFLNFAIEDIQLTPNSGISVFLTSANLAYTRELHQNCSTTKNKEARKIRSTRSHFLVGHRIPGR